MSFFYFFALSRVRYAFLWGILGYFFTCQNICHAQQSLSQKVHELNNAKRYEDVQKMLLDITTDKSRQDDEVMEAYLLLSDTRKRLFDYGKTKYYLSKALEYSNTRKDSNIILSRRAMATFDVQEYRSSDSIMDYLAANNYEGISLSATSMLIMQKGYIHYKNEEYEQSLNRYESALAMMAEAKNCHEPIVIGKMMVLAAALDNVEEIHGLYQKGVQRAKECKIQKYELYLVEEYKRSLKDVGDVESAQIMVAVEDSLKQLYKSSSYLEGLNANLDKYKPKSEFRWYWIVLLGVCFFLVGYYLKTINMHKYKEQSVDDSTVDPPVTTSVEKKHTQLEGRVIYKQSKSVDNFVYEDKVDQISEFDWKNNRHLFRKRQWEVLQYLVKDKSNEYIANKLYLSVSTVKYHISSIQKVLKEVGWKYIRESNEFRRL